MKLIVSASYFELKPLLDYYTPKKIISPIKGKKFKPNIYQMGAVLMVVAGVGPVYSLPLLQSLIERYVISDILIVGSCGGAAKKVGRWCCCSAVSLKYPGRLWGNYDYDPPLPKWSKLLIKKNKIDCLTLYTVPDIAVVSDHDDAIYDMEGGFWINLARINKIPVLLLKKITDSGEKDGSAIASSYLEGSGTLFEVVEQLIDS